MIGKYTDDDFFEKLTTDEQRNYLMSIASDMTNKKAKELIYKINDIRTSSIIYLLKDIPSYLSTNIIK